MTASRTRRDLRAMVWDGVFFSVMVGAGERYLQAFAVDLGYGDLPVGLLAALPTLLGATLQLGAPWAVRHLGSQRTWVVACCVLQALAWIPLAVGAWSGRLGLVPLFGAATLYWAAGYAASPAWTSWVGTLIPPRLREHYLGRRQAACQAGLFVALVAAGVTLHAVEGRGDVFPVYGALFVGAFVARAVSTAFVASQSEPVPLAPDFAHVTLWDVVRRLPRDAALRAVFCVAPMQAAVFTAEPYFTPYVRRQLRVDYATYLTLVAAGLLGRLSTLPAAGRLAARFGARRILWAGAIGLVPSALLWSLSPAPEWLVVAQFVSGVAWGAFELGAFLVFYDALPESERTAVVTVWFFVMAAAGTAGAWAGGALLGALGTGRTAYLWLFAVSTALRLGAAFAVSGLRRRDAGELADPSRPAAGG